MISSQMESRGFLSLLICFFLVSRLAAQDALYLSVHREQSATYAAYGDREPSFYDSLNGFTRAVDRRWPACQLHRMVFGYQPYWMGSSYLNYQWNLLSDLCYFAYEVDPTTGNASSIHDWLTDPSIDSAYANGVRVHLCVTLFSGHTAFFTNPGARQTLIGNLISLVQQRGAQGINLDFEAVPASQGSNMTGFVLELSSALDTLLPGTLISMAIPAVNWNNTFDIRALSPFVDYFIVMGYDYYWNGSAQAGPVAPLYSLTPSNDISLARTISDYQAQGLPRDKFVLGIPYYGRQWKTQSNLIPSATLATGTAWTYANIRNNGGGNYSPQNYVWDARSSSSCYIFFQNGNWNQCFIGLDKDVRNWYDIVHYRGLAGIGIWALGYDNGYPDLWQAISDKFTDCFIPLTYDTIYDAGGPAWNYYPGESYTLTIEQGFTDLRWLTVSAYDLEPGYDSLWIFAGKDTLAPLLAAISGSGNAAAYSSADGAFTLRFRADQLNQRAGWTAIYHDGTLDAGEAVPSDQSGISLYPNPARNFVIIYNSERTQPGRLIISNINGSVVLQSNIAAPGQPGRNILVDLSEWPSGVYVVTYEDPSGHKKSRLLLKTG